MEVYLPDTDWVNSTSNAEEAETYTYVWNTTGSRQAQMRREILGVP